MACGRRCRSAREELIDWYRSRPIYGPYEADVGRFVDLDKEDFIGKRAAMIEREQGGTLGG